MSQSRNRNKQRRGKRDVPKRVSHNHAAEQYLYLENDEAKLEEALYLHSFVDPHYAARGPGTGCHPTALLNFHYSELVTIGVPTTSTTAWDSSFGTVRTNSGTMNSNGDVMICMTPIACAAQTALTDTPATLYPGFICDPDLAMSVNIQGSADPRPIGETDFGLLEGFDLNYPGALEMQAADVLSGMSAEVPFRFVGLKGEIESTTALLDNQGYIYGGDFETYIIDHRQDFLMYGTGNAEVASVEADEHNDQEIRGSVSRNNRLCTCGPVLLGNKYEATYLPMGDHILPFRSHFPGCELGITGPVNAKFLTFAASQPMLTFLIKGMDTTKPYSFRVGCNWAIEVPVTKRSAVGILYAEAKLARRFVPDWTTFSSIHPGGICGLAHAQFLDEGASVFSHAIHGGMMLAPEEHRPHQVGVSTISHTKGIIGAALGATATAIGTQKMVGAGARAAARLMPQAAKTAVSRSIFGAFGRAASRFAANIAEKAATALPRLAARAVTALL